MNQKQAEIKKELIENALKTCEIKREIYPRDDGEPYIKQFFPNEEYFVYVYFLDKVYYSKSKRNPKEHQNLKYAMLQDIKKEIYDDYQLN